MAKKLLLPVILLAVPAVFFITNLTAFLARGAEATVGTAELGERATVFDSNNTPQRAGGRRRLLAEGVLLGDKYFVIYGSDNIHTYATSTDGTSPVGIIMQYGNDGKGGARIGTAKAYTYGTFTAVLKTPGGSTSGVVSAFYLASTSPSDQSAFGDPSRDELDFEFLGNQRRMVQTNYLVNGVGWNNHEVKEHLDFDTAAEFHEYKIVWTQRKVQWFVDGKLVRELWAGNNQQIPSKPMYLYFSIWASQDMSSYNPGLIGWCGQYDGSSAPYSLNIPKIYVPYL